VDDARGNLHLFDAGQAGLGGNQGLHETVEREEARIEVDLERSDAGGQVEQPGGLASDQRLVQGMDAEAEVQVEDERTVFDKKIAVSRPPVADRR
jgi:hypothetical protein